MIMGFVGTFEHGLLAYFSNIFNFWQKCCLFCTVKATFLPEMKNIGKIQLLMDNYFSVLKKKTFPFRFSLISIQFNFKSRGQSKHASSRQIVSRVKDKNIPLNLKDIEFHRDLYYLLILGQRCTNILIAFC